MRHGIENVRAPHDGRRGEHVAPSLAGGKPRDVAGVVIVARPRRDMQVFALRVHRRACERHPVLPAVERANRERAERMRAQSVPIAGRPAEPLFVRRHELAVHRTDHALLVDVHQRAIRAVATTILRSFDGAEYDRDLPLFRHRADRVEVSRVDVDRLVQVVRVECLLQR